MLSRPSSSLVGFKLLRFRNWTYFILAWRLFGQRALHESEWTKKFWPNEFEKLSIQNISYESCLQGRLQALTFLVAQPIVASLDWVSYHSFELYLVTFVPYQAYSKIDLNNSNKFVSRYQDVFLTSTGQYALSGE